MSELDEPTSGWHTEVVYDDEGNPVDTNQCNCSTGHDH